MATLIEAFQYGTPGLLFVLIILNVWAITKIKDLVESVNNLKEGVIWGDRFEDFKEDIERRLDRLEDKANGKK